MKEKLFNYFWAAIIGAFCGGCVLSSFFGFGYGILSGIVWSVISFHNLFKEMDADKKKFAKEREDLERENDISMKKYRAQKRKEKKERKERRALNIENRAWLGLD